MTILYYKKRGYHSKKDNIFFNPQFKMKKKLNLQIVDKNDVIENDN